MMLTAVVWNIAWFVLQAAYVPYAMRHLGLNAGGVGFTLGCYGAGMLVGALLAARAARTLPFGAAVMLGPSMSVLAAAAMLASWWWPHAAWAALSFVLFGAGPLVWTVTTTTLRQTLVPSHDAGPGVGDLPHGECRCAAARRGARRLRGRALGRRRRASRWPRWASWCRRC